MSGDHLNKPSGAPLLLSCALGVAAGGYLLWSRAGREEALVYSPAPPTQPATLEETPPPPPPQRATRAEALAPTAPPAPSSTPAPLTPTPTTAASPPRPPLPPYPAEGWPLERAGALGAALGEAEGFLLSRYGLARLSAEEGGGVGRPGLGVGVHLIAGEGEDAGRVAALEVRLTPEASAAALTALEQHLTGRGEPWGLRLELDARDPHDPVAGVLRREGLEDAYYYCEYAAPREGLTSSPARCVLSLGAPPDEVRRRPASAPPLAPARSWLSDALTPPPPPPTPRGL